MHDRSEAERRATTRPAVGLRKPDLEGREAARKKEGRVIQAIFQLFYLGDFNPGDFRLRDFN